MNSRLLQAGSTPTGLQVGEGASGAQLEDFFAGTFGIELKVDLPYVLPVVTAKQLRELLAGKPFKPFRICLSDVTHYDITNHDMAWVMKNTVEVGLNIDLDGFAEYAARCSILHITQPEDIPHPVAG